MTTLVEVNETLKEQGETQQRTAEDINALKNVMVRFVAFSKQNSLDQLEAQREAKAQAGAPVAQAQIEKKPSEGGFGLAAILAGVGALIVGFGQGLMESVKAWIKTVRAIFSGLFSRLIKAFRGLGRAIGLDIVFKDLQKAFRSFIDPIIDFFKGRAAATTSRFANITDAINDFFKPLTTFVDNFKTGFSRINTRAVGMFDDILKMDDFSTFAGKIGAGFRRIISFVLGPLESAENLADMSTVGTRISDAISNFIKPITNFFSAEGPLGRFFGMMRSAFSFAAEGSGVMKLLGSVGKIAGRLFYPLGIFMTIWDTISGAFKGFVDDEGNLGSKVLAGIEGGIAGFLKGLIGIPLDLIKSGISWIAGKLGAEGIEKSLDSFSFEELIGTAINTIFGIFRSAINGIIELVAQGVDAIPLVPDKVVDGIRSLKLAEPTAPEATTAPSAESNTPSAQPGFSPRLQRKLAKQEQKRQQMAGGSASQASVSNENNISPNYSQAEKIPAITGQVIERGAAASQTPAPSITTVGDSVVNNTSSSNQSMIMPPSPPIDFGDPMLAGS